MEAIGTLFLRVNVGENVPVLILPYYPLGEANDSSKEK